MNKKQLIIVLESTLLSFDGLNEQKIKNLNAEYNSTLIKVGFRLNSFLNDKIKEKEVQK